MYFSWLIIKFGKFSLNPKNLWGSGQFRRSVLLKNFVDLPVYLLGFSN